MSLYFNGNKQMQISYDMVTDHEPETFNVDILIGHELGISESYWLIQRSMCTVY